jgi:hypothetical protein
MERYRGVKGGPRINKISAAIEASGATILSAPNPSEAPFEYTVRTPEGEVLELICYAFTANKYGQGNRPQGEHRFQVKYGNDFTRLHELSIDRSPTRLTLFFGVHDELSLFIAADPAMHNPTWFSCSIEFKEGDLDIARATGWHAWQRDRVLRGRRRALGAEDARTEVLLAFRPEHFLSYALFERLTTGMDSGERLSLADQVEHRLIAAQPAHDLLELPSETGNERTLASHPLLLQLGLSPSDLLDVIGERFRLLAAVRGGAAEHHLGRMLPTIPGVKDVERLDEDGQPDFSLRYREREVRVECKNILRELSKGRPRVDFQKTRAAKNDPCSRYYRPDQFDVLAACLHPWKGTWTFSFCATRSLPPHRTCPKRLSERVLVDGPNWTPELRQILDQLTT